MVYIDVDFVVVVFRSCVIVARFVLLCVVFVINGCFEDRRALKPPARSSNVDYST